MDWPTVALETQANSLKPLGLIPADTGSDLARSLNIPEHPERAADVIMRGFYTTTDLGKVHDGKGTSMWSSTIAAIGTDAHAAQKARQLNPRLESLRYPLAAANSLPHFRGHRAKIVLDLERVIEGEFAQIRIGNTPYYGQGMRMCPDANHHDGLLDITMVRPAPRLQAFRDLARGYVRGIKDLPNVSFAQAAHISLEKRGQPITADGEPFANDKAEFEALEGAGRFLVPRP
ncbi:diacylglycerol/lipid kinase family protein [Corynebacterium epidermidicanis]|nr:diacylglycerol kinase family protein [Corynebacterium epidermidicanis]